MSEPTIETVGLDVRIGGHVALRGVSMQLAAGDFLAVMGPNGSGKSTFIKALLGIRLASRGTVRVFGKDPGEVDPMRIGYVPQIKTFDRTFPALSLDLVVSGLLGRWPGRLSSVARTRALDALSRVRAGGLAMKRIGALSGGELQRVYLARAFVREPSLILLDEPATGIDVLGEADFYQLLDGYRSNSEVTIVMVTHDWEAAFHHASHILLLRGEQVAFGPPVEALSEQKLREAFGHVGHAHTIYGGDHDD